jgi:SOS response regulatory protein OraA/RecX
MRAYFLLPAFVLVLASAGYWVAKRDTPDAGKDNVTVSAVIKAGGLKKDTHRPYTSVQSPLPQQAEVKDALVYDLNNPADKEQMAASLRAEGIPEKEIQRILNPIEKEASPPIEANVAEAESYDMNNPADKEQMVTSLRAEGISDNEIQRILNPIVKEASPPIEADVAEAESYDMNNPAEKEQMAASLKAEGVSEKDIQQILSHSAAEPQFPISD